jgi:translation initiation factor 1 (eIF-1/SUI1)
MKRGMLTTIVCAVTLFAASGTVSAEQTSRFTDVPSSHWAMSAIEWGIEKNAVVGYGDGTFQPNRYVTEAEFLRMLLSSYQLQASGSKDDHWANKYYDYAQANQWISLAGFSDTSAKDKPISRGNTALIINNALGIDPQSVETAILKLYELNLSSGKTEKSVVGFQANQFLTRAEAISFIRNFADQYDSVKAVNRIIRETSAEVKTKLTLTGVTDLTRQIAAEKQYRVTVSGVTIIGNETVVPDAKTIYVERVEESNKTTQLLTIDVNTNPKDRKLLLTLSNINGAKKDSLQLAYDLLKELAVGGMVSQDEFYKTLTDNREAYMGGIYLKSISNEDGTYPTFVSNQIVSDMIGSIEIVQ